MPSFTVDTHLFRELGDLLVGRDSTALIELIKNSYDADASSVSVYAENLDDEIQGLIQISDDGIGMTSFAFMRGFLRVGLFVIEFLLVLLNSEGTLCFSIQLVLALRIVDCLAACLCGISD